MLFTFILETLGFPTIDNVLLIVISFKLVKSISWSVSIYISDTEGSSSAFLKSLVFVTFLTFVGKVTLYDE